MDDVIPVTLKSTLERVCRKFFNRNAAHKSPKHQRFVELYQATFEKDFEVREWENAVEACYQSIDRSIGRSTDQPITRVTRWRGPPFSGTAHIQSKSGRS